MAHRGEPALAGKLPALTRRLAEAHVACGQLEEAEAALSELLSAHPSAPARMLAVAVAAGEAGAGAGGAGSPRGLLSGSSSASATPTARAAAAGAAAAAAAVAAAAALGAAAEGAAASTEGTSGIDPEERLSLLCLLADIQLREDRAAIEARVAARIAKRTEEEGGDASKVRARRARG
jgi:hypothetical protein